MEFSNYWVIYPNRWIICRIDAELAPLGEEVAAINDELNELLASFTALPGNGIQPARLDAIEERLALLNTLKENHGGSLHAVLEFAARAEEQLAGLKIFRIRRKI